MKRVPLYERLPAIYRLEDAKQNPPYPLKAFIEALEDVFSEVHKDIEGLYHNFFIDTCDPWAIPYLGDLVGSTPLAGDARTLRADVAETVAIRRRKGTLESIDRLATALTGWPTLVVELKERLAWFQHLNHFRPDAGGEFPSSPRGGTLLLRDREKMAYLSTPYEQVSRTVDLKPRVRDEIRLNIPNVAVYLWRTRLFQIHRAQPGYVDIKDYNAHWKVLRVVMHPLGQTAKGRPLRLFGKKGPLLRDALYEDVRVNGDRQDLAVNLHLPNYATSWKWDYRGADLCRWGEVTNFSFSRETVLVDPQQGRLLIAVPAAEADFISQNILLSYWVGSPGDVGALPVSQRRLPEPWNGEQSKIFQVHREADGLSLQRQLEKASVEDQPTVIEIADSGTYILDFSTLVQNPGIEKGSLTLRHPLLVRAAADVRPVILLKTPLKFRPEKILAEPLGDEEEQKQIDGANSRLNLRWEGILFGRHEKWKGPSRELFAAHALNELSFYHCTLDPLGYKLPNERRENGEPSLVLTKDFGLDSDEEIQHLKQRPRIRLEKSISGAICAGALYELVVVDSIIDGVAGEALNSPAGEVAKGSLQGGPLLELHGATFLGPCQVHGITGEGGVFSQTLKVWDTQKGCLSYSTFLDAGSRLPRVHACYRRKSPQALRFTGVAMDSPAYAQLSRNSVKEILEQGPPREGAFGDQMGAYGFLMETQRWKNLETRLREYSPVGSVLLMVPVPDFY